MKVEFDPIKRNLTLAERGLDFLDAPIVIENAVTTFEDTRFEYEETRLVTYGLLNRRLIAVVWVEIEGGMRVISMRKANNREQKRYQG
jgi:uncharacterized DUF497 family protein